jgi:hypothetical protein
VINRLIFLALVGAGLGYAQPMPTDESLLSRSTSPGRARVVLVEDPRAVIAFNAIPIVVEEMVDKGIRALAGKDDPSAAWRTFVSPQDTVGVKVCAAPGPTSGTRPAVVSAVVRGLLTAGVPASQIVIWDKHLSDLRLAGFDEIASRHGVQLAGSAEEGYDEQKFYDAALLGKLVWGDLEFGKKGDSVGRRSFVSKLLTRRLSKIINVTPLLNHNLAQVTGNLYGLAMGSVDNTIRFEAAPQPLTRLAQAIPEIFALAEIGDKVALNIVDALICQYQGEERTLLHYSTMLNQIRLSTDPVALDVLSVHELDRQRQLSRLPPVRLSWQIYTNAALLDLGVSDLRRMDVIRVDSARREERASLLGH